MRSIHRIIYSAMMILAATLHGTGCQPVDKSELETRMRIFQWISDQFLYGSTNYLVDNQDGTVVLMERDNKGWEYRRSLLKKCLQGQLYRPLPDNDCRGAGSAADNWGALLLQYCSTDDSACNQQGIIVTGPNSPIYTSCTGETLNALSWVPWFNLYYYDVTANSLRTKEFASVYADVPREVKIWTATAGPGTTSAVYVQYPYTTGTALKTTPMLTLCSTDSY